MFWRRRTLLEKAAVLLLILTLLVEYLGGGRPAALAVTLNLLTAGAFLALVFRYLKALLSALIWRLRNRLLITYLFIGVIPVLLVGGMTLIAAYLFYGQVATYMAAEEVQKLTDELGHSTRTAAARVEAGRPGIQAAVAQEVPKLLPKSLQGLNPEVQLIDEGAAPIWLKTDFEGLVLEGGEYRLRAVYRAGSKRLQVSAALQRSLESWLPSTIGVAYLAREGRSTGSALLKMGAQTYQAPTAAPTLPPKAYWADISVRWLFTVPVADWDSGAVDKSALLFVETRPSILNQRLFSTLGEYSTAPLTLLAVVGVLFLLIEAGALMVGVGLTRSITTAVNDLYEATQRVNRRDFSYRIPVRSHDQLSVLAASFNSMTMSLDRLIAESKEKERLESELQIAREVQSQLFPKQVPLLRGLEIAGVCNPARVVSGDYYDFVSFDDTRMALAIGDIAGKGISAALIMAGIQSALRSQLHQVRQTLPSGVDGVCGTSALVGQLNRQLYETTSASTFATFCYAVYDDVEGRLTYTNAGHLPPLVVGRDGTVRRLTEGGLVLGFMPGVNYQQASILLQPGDVVVAYTDGITEPENAYGGEFGEERLVEVIQKFHDKSPQQIAFAVLAAVQEWNDSPEAADDMTLLVARRIGD